LKKNILYISPNFNLACGVSKHVYTLLTSEELKEKFNLYYITNGGDAIFKLDKANVNYRIVNFGTDTAFHLDFFNNKKELKKFCTENEIDIIHSHHRYPEFLVNTIKKSLRLKTVVTVHNFVKGLKHFSYKSDRLIAISNAVSDHLINHFKISPDRIKVLYNCVCNENNTFESKKEIKEKFGIQKQKSILLYIGRFSEEKGTDILLKAFKLLIGFYQNIFLIMIGGDKDLLLSEVNDIRSDRIKTFPTIENLAEFYSIADMVILPSVSEGLGYTMLEAGLYKIPFIGSRTGGIADFIEEGINGYLFEPGNSYDLAEKIKFIIEHTDVARYSALKLNEKVLRLCNSKNYFEKLNNIYNLLLAET